MVEGAKYDLETGLDTFDLPRDALATARLPRASTPVMEYYPPILHSTACHLSRLLLSSCCAGLTGHSCCLSLYRAE